MNVSIEGYCRELADMSISYDQLEWFLDSRVKKSQEIERGNLFGLMGEAHTLLAIERLQCRYPKAVSIYNLKRRKEKGGYIFTSTKGRPNINFEKKLPSKRRARRKAEVDMGELDLIVMMNGTPIVIETHLGNYDKNKGGKKCSLQSKLRESQVSMKIKPTKVLCNTPDVRLVYVVRKEFEEKRYIPESNMNKFVNEGGIIIPFARGNEEWLEFIDRLQGRSVA